MIKVLFVCHGNICRSPMAEHILKALKHRHRLQRLQKLQCSGFDCLVL